jgi:hypothetical protein
MVKFNGTSFTWYVILCGDCTVIIGGSVLGSGGKEGGDKKGFAETKLTTCAPTIVERSAATSVRAAFFTGCYLYPVS